MSAASSPTTNPFLSPIAVVGGGIGGLAVAYELARHGADFSLFEASGRLGGPVETIHSEGFVIECGPDSWVTEKPGARALAVELGLEDQILPSNDQSRRTYLVKGGELIPLPDGMRMMAPVKWGPLLRSPLFSWKARLAYLREPGRAKELKTSAPQGKDESVAAFVRRHFGEEVTETIAGPLLAGVFGGDIRTLSARAVLPAFVKMEAEHGSVIAALRHKAREPHRRQPIFSTLASGLETLIDRLVQRLPAHSVHLRQPVEDIHVDGESWRLRTPSGEHRFGCIVLATPPHVTRKLLRSLTGNGPRMADLLPQQATSAIVVALAFDASQAARMRIPRGFGFLVPPTAPSGDEASESGLLACTFLDQKFPHRAPSGAILLRAFWGGPQGDALLEESDEALVRMARQQLSILLGQGGPLPEPAGAAVRRWPLSLPQYSVGHLDRIAELESLASTWRGLYLAGNAYHGVGLSDLIRQGRATARTLLGAV